VHELITKNGLGQFYDLQESGVAPVKSVVFHPRDFSWLNESVARAEAGGEAPEIELELQGISCIGCVWLIENVAARTPGVLSLRADPTQGRCRVRWQRGACDVTGLARQLQSFGYLLGPPGAKPAGRALLVRLGICAALAMNAMLFTLPGYLGMEASFPFAPLFAQFTLLIATLSLVIGGSYFFTRSWHSLRRGVLHIDLPISLGLLAAYGGSLYAWSKGASALVYFDFVSIFVFLMLVGRWLQQKAVERNRHRLLSADGSLPDVENPETGARIAASALAVGSVFLVAPGRAVPVRAKLRSEAATLGLEWINGESEAVTSRRGRAVPSGAINCGQRGIELEALESWPESLLFRLFQPAPAGEPRERSLERFIRAYLVIVICIAAAGGAAWWIVTGDAVRSLQILISVLVVSCPCASGVALPLADDLAAAALRNVGVFVRTTSLWARLARVKKILFDKTGTLTLETMALRNPEALAALDAEAKGALLAMVRHNLHPVSCALREALLADGVGEEPILEAPEEHIGDGLELRTDTRTWRLGRAAWAAAAGAETADAVFTREGAVLAAFRFGDDVRQDAPDEIAGLRQRGCEVFILSGDRSEKVALMADHLGLPRAQCFGSMNPTDKARWVTEHDAHDTLLIGDGANDSLAFNAAWCTGTPAIDRGLLEHKADFYFLGRNLAGIRHLLDIAAQRRRTVRRVVTFAISYNAVAVALALAGWMNPLVAAVLMPASSLVSLAIVLGSSARRCV
jgi:Cu2+-exporting ATPase